MQVFLANRQIVTGGGGVGKDREEGVSVRWSQVFFKVIIDHFHSNADILLLEICCRSQGSIIVPPVLLQYCTFSLFVTHVSCVRVDFHCRVIFT